MQIILICLFQLWVCECVSVDVAICVVLACELFFPMEFFSYGKSASKRSLFTVYVYANAKQSVFYVW